MIATIIVGTGQESPKNAMPTTTASEAPERMPKMPGSASGLRVMAWNVVPDMASAAPTKSANTVRGTRRYAAASLAVAVEPPRAERASDREIVRTPNMTEATTARAVAARSPMMTAVFFAAT